MIPQIWKDGKRRLCRVIVHYTRLKWTERKAKMHILLKVILYSETSTQWKKDFNGQWSKPKKTAGGLGRWSLSEIFLGLCSPLAGVGVGRGLEASLICQHRWTQISLCLRLFSTIHHRHTITSITPLSAAETCPWAAVKSPGKLQAISQAWTVEWRSWITHSLEAMWLSPERARPVVHFVNGSVYVGCKALPFGGQQHSQSCETLSSIPLRAVVPGHMKRWWPERVPLPVLGRSWPLAVTEVNHHPMDHKADSCLDGVNTKEILRQRTLWKLEKINEQIWFNSIRPTTERALSSFPPSWKRRDILQRPESYWPMPSLSYNQKATWVI